MKKVRLFAVAAAMGMFASTVTAAEQLLLMLVLGVLLMKSSRLTLVIR